MLPVMCSSMSRSAGRESMGPPRVRRSASVSTRRPLLRRPMPGSFNAVEGVSTRMSVPGPYSVEAWRTGVAGITIEPIMSAIVSCNRSSSSGTGALMPAVTASVPRA